MAAKFMQHLNDKNQAVSLRAAAEEVRQVLSTSPLCKVEPVDCTLLTDEVSIGKLAEHFRSRKCLSIYLPASPRRPHNTLVDVLDILHWALKHAPAGFNLKNISEYFTALAHLPMPTVEDGFGKAIYPVSGTVTMADLLLNFSMNLSFIAPLEEPSMGGNVSTISITCIIRTFHAELQAGRLRMFGLVPVEKLLSAAQPPSMVKSTDTLLAAMHKLHTKCNRFSAAAVVSPETGMLEGCLSARDLADIYMGSVSVMTRVSQFIKEHCGPACVCTPTTNLLELIADMLAIGRHHAFVVDNCYVPIACLSMSDIVALVCDPSLFGSPAVRAAPSPPLPCHADLPPLPPSSFSLEAGKHPSTSPPR
eukprot:GGOE01061560.1.p2 GENE.GGOE01061560.1~~GGOE01061560.1.p2  ORF type:complete len:371 (+),score=84.78 GGOE01061560.1:27-1115(+)